MKIFAMGTLAMAAALLALAVPASAWPDCTCDPNPVTNLAHCLVGDESYCPSVPGAPSVGPLPSVHDLLTPPPCTCDPIPVDH